MIFWAVNFEGLQLSDILPLLEAVGKKSKIFIQWGTRSRENSTFIMPLHNVFRDEGCSLIAIPGGLLMS
jgi:hypothetical protein